MLERTFIHVPGIGRQAERSLWDQGCFGWTDLLERMDQFSVGSVDRTLLTRHLNRSISASQEGEHQFFRRHLGMKEAWRAFPDFRHSCVYLDIETDGRNDPDGITTVGLFDGVDYRCLIQDEDLGNFPDVISNYSMIVTFYGAGFDLPILQKRFPSARLDQIHIDLCPLLKRAGHRGGLKKIEKDLGISRCPELDGLNGYDAVKLWRRYVQRGDAGALRTLVAYNREDVVNLKPLAEYAYKKLWSETYQDRLPL